MKNLVEFISESIFLEANSEAVKSIEMTLNDGKDFMIVGDPKSGKENLVQKIASKKVQVQNVYMDKMEPDDLGGLPVVKDGKKITLLPDWAANISKSNAKTLVIFSFEGCKNIDPKLLNALMPIVLEHKVVNEKLDMIACLLFDEMPSDLPKALSSHLGSPIIVEK